MLFKKKPNLQADLSDCRSLDFVFILGDRNTWLSVTQNEHNVLTKQISFMRMIQCIISRMEKMTEAQHLRGDQADDFHPGALTDIYRDDVAMAVWRRELDVQVATYSKVLLQKTPCFQTRFIQSPSQVAQYLENELPLHKCRESFLDDVSLVVDMFSCLFELEAVGVRMAVLNSAMCPKFHVDHVPCRLICTYAGAGTEWHSHENIERFDNGSLAPTPNVKFSEISVGDVALLKGETWEGNEGRGQVHRSPHASDSARRLVLTLDFA